MACSGRRRSSRVSFSPESEYLSFMSEGWRSELKVDPVPLLRASNSEAIRFLARRDFLGEAGGDERTLWELPAATKLVEKQRADGSWKYPSRKALQCAYDTLQTYRTLGDST